MLLVIVIWYLWWDIWYFGLMISIWNGILGTRRTKYQLGSLDCIFCCLLYSIWCIWYLGTLVLFGILCLVFVLLGIWKILNMAVWMEWFALLDIRDDVFDTQEPSFLFGMLCLLFSLIHLLFGMILFRDPNVCPRPQGSIIWGPLFLPKTNNLN